MDEKEIKKILSHPDLIENWARRQKNREEFQKAEAELKARFKKQYAYEALATATPEQRQKFLEDQCKYLGIKSAYVWGWMGQEEHKP